MRWAKMLVPVVLLAVGVAAGGCTGAASVTATQAPTAKNPLAGQLYDLASETDSALLELEQTLPNAIQQGDAAAIESAIHKADDLKRAWHKQAAGASGDLSAASGKYEESIALRIRMFEEASRTVLSHSVEASRAMVRLQQDGWALAIEAQGAIKVLK